MYAPPTPSAAAELVVQAKADLEQQVDGLRRHLAGALHQRLLTLRNRFVRSAGSYVFREPQNLLQRHGQTVSRLQERLQRALLDAVRVRHQRLDEAAAVLATALPRAVERTSRNVERLGLRLQHPMLMAVQRARQKVIHLTAQLQAFSPLAVLERGYSITHNARGEVLRDPDQARPGEKLQTRLARGVLHSTVLTVERKP
jgi:exodeoxyribonuclease VII large subunit